MFVEFQNTNILKNILWTIFVKLFLKIIHIFSAVYNIFLNYRQYTFNIFGSNFGVLVVYYMKVSFLNIGCKLNFADMSEIQKQFTDKGFDVVDFEDKADVVLINTCTVTHNADADSRKYIRRAIRNNPDAFIAVTGCYSQLKPDEVLKIDGVDAVFGTNTKFSISELIDKFEKRTKPELFVPDMENVPFHFASSVENNSRTRIVVKIQDGCDYVCTYCAVPYARGKSRSMNFGELKEKLQEISDSNYHEVVLSGINLGEYRAESGEKFSDVIRYIANSDLKFRTRISSIEPNLVTDEIIDLVNNSDKLCKHFHIPLQSGSPDILKAMKRRYRAGDFVRLVEKIKNINSDICIGADVIAGFPGESQTNFDETANLLKMLPVSYLHVFTYSERDITPASKYENQVYVNIRKLRTKVLRTLSDEKQIRFIMSQIGNTLNVVPEKDFLQNGIYYEEGLTDNYIRVKYKVQNPTSQPKKIILDKASGKIVTGKLYEIS